MARLRWTKDIRFTDHSRNFATDGPGEYDVPDDVAERYLSHRSNGWERVDETESGYSRDELEDKDWSELRQMAVESDKEDINGRSSKADIVEAFADG